MPNKATVRGVLMDATLAPVSGGKVIATLNGSDVFENGVHVVTQRIEATTDQNGEWSMALIVNGEGDAAGTTWTVEGYDQFVSKVFEAKPLFIPVALAATLGDLEKTSAQNLRAARDGSVSRLIIVGDYSEYAALPQSQRRDTDLVLVKGE
ncbi:hypothetical protein SAMN04487972_108139 [Paracoccus halophilus]|uniref:Uncharacterized protein n=1 Tax=Paracoccus halophilus TaxID=376733 RepID=A0A099F2C5_9RHOB|nr:hypothetical protein [Paracoccus halophilus]KGJ04845.1 hypothetical protein IT41_09295 [Paracoccus halophilus]SFA51487.1 hypothetical protein SAMN04487972_108139 [Paracoccus halophilus]